MAIKSPNVRIETQLTNSIKQSDHKSMYDETCKRILSSKGILAQIMKGCVIEYENVPIKDIADLYIEKEPHVAAITVFSGESIDGLPTEDIGLNEGKIFYDIRYRALAPHHGEVVELIINIEAQNQYNPGYSLVKRGIYYDCRMISGQYGTDFDKMDYNKIKKVYSIWICRNVPKELENSITSYDIHETNVIGNTKEKKENYDLMSVVMIYLGQATDTSESDVLKLLNRLLSEEVSAREKLNMLSEEYQIPSTQDLESEVEQMCNLSQGIEDKAIKKGIEKGASKKAIEIAKNLFSMNFTLEQVTNATGLAGSVAKRLKEEFLNQEC